MWVSNGCFKNDFNWTKYALAVHYNFNLRINWMDRHKVTPIMTISRFGWCKTFNVVEDHQMMNLDTTVGYFRYISQQASNPLDFLTSMPLMTSKKDVGYRSAVSIPLMKFIPCRFGDGCNAQSLRNVLIIHSPYEMPDIKHRRLILNSHDLVKVAIEAQINIADETVLELEFNE